MRSFFRNLWASVGRTGLRVVGAILVTAGVPLLVAMWLNGCVLERVSDAAFNPEVSERLDSSLEVYADLVKSMKSDMRHEAELISLGRELGAAVTTGDARATARALERVLVERPAVHSVRLESPDGEVLAERARPEPLDETRFRPFTAGHAVGDDPEAPTLAVVFAADRRRVDEMEGAQLFAQAWKLHSQDRHNFVVRPYRQVYALVFGLTVLLAVATGILVVRPVTRRILRLAAATRPVAAGDLSVRVAVTGKDEIATLGQAFNHMLETLSQSRARIEFLQRIGEWQSMARRLAHEIKNPLTPIQLAVEECHRRYPGKDDDYRKLLDATLDIVTEEVRGLRRLVGEFSGFARLPRSTPEPCELGGYLEGELERLRQSELTPSRRADPKRPAPPALELELDGAPEPLAVALDREMFYRVLANLVQNAAQALAATPGRTHGRIVLRARRDGDYAVLDVDDDGPGIPDDLKPSVFDPYRTTKQEGTGLGLAIVKKVVIEHGGLVEALDAPGGGARMRLRLPLRGSNAAEAAALDAPAAA
ncbi:MAG: HAMP domain-containing protein [Myxococcales bacterium]|nr:HAMP domain-containing protein [Myxococcales bacterium]